MPPSNRAPMNSASQSSHLGKGEIDSEHPLSTLDKLRAIADAEAFHNKKKGVKVPSAFGRQWLAKTYPEMYPEWGHLVAAKSGSSLTAAKGHADMLILDGNSTPQAAAQAGQNHDKFKGEEDIATPGHSASAGRQLDPSVSLDAAQQDKLPQLNSGMISAKEVVTKHHQSQEPTLQGHQHGSLVIRGGERSPDDLGRGQAKDRDGKLTQAAKMQNRSRVMANAPTQPKKVPARPPKTWEEVQGQRLREAQAERLRRAAELEVENEKLLFSEPHKQILPMLSSKAGGSHKGGHLPKYPVLEPGKTGADWEVQSRQSSRTRDDDEAMLMKYPTLEPKRQSNGLDVHSRQLTPVSSNGERLTLAEYPALEPAKLSKDYGRVEAKVDDDLMDLNIDGERVMQGSSRVQNDQAANSRGETEAYDKNTTEKMELIEEITAQWERCLLDG